MGHGGIGFTALERGAEVGLRVAISSGLRTLLAGYLPIGLRIQRRRRRRFARARPAPSRTTMRALGWSSRRRTLRWSQLAGETLEPLFFPQGMPRDFAGEDYVGEG